MIIGIDYDGTITTDPDLWYALMGSAERRGHTVIVVTGRSGEEHGRIEYLREHCPDAWRLAKHNGWI